jgi:hypothetical protein
MREKRRKYFKNNERRRRGVIIVDNDCQQLRLSSSGNTSFAKRGG